METPRFYHLLVKCPQLPSALSHEHLQRRIADTIRATRQLRLHRFFWDQNRLEAIVSSSEPSFRLNGLENKLRSLKFSLRLPAAYHQYSDRNLTFLRALESTRSAPWMKEICEELPEPFHLRSLPAGSIYRFKILYQRQVIWPLKKVIFLESASA